MENKSEQLTKILKESNNIVFFGGAGVSTESGIPDFRSSNGLFNEKLNITFTPEQLVSDEKFILESKGVPTCTKCGGRVKPDVVLYEEGLDDSTIRGAVNAIANADTLIIGGTSLVVYPAAGLIDYFNGKNLVLINKSSTSADSKADLVINDSIGKVLSTAINSIS